MELKYKRVGAKVYELVIAPAEKKGGKKSKEEILSITTEEEYLTI